MYEQQENIEAPLTKISRYSYAIRRIASYVGIIIVAVGLLYLFCNRIVESPYGSRGHSTLKSIGICEYEFRRKNAEKLYGSFEDLKEAGYITEGYSLGNMIENYSMTWEVNNVSTVMSEDFPTGIISTFTVIAYPRDTRPGYLETFGVTDDQVVRVYNPKNGNDRYRVWTWDPIL